MIMRIYNTSSTVTIHENVPVTINSVGSYRVRIPHIYFDAIGVVRTGLKFKDTGSGKYEITPNYDNKGKITKIYDKTSYNYEISLPKKIITELKLLDNYLKSLDNVKDRETVYLHFRLRINVKENARDLICYFTNESLKLLK